MDAHPYAPGVPDPHTVPVVFRWLAGMDPEQLVVGVDARHPDKRLWLASRSQCRIVVIEDEPQLPESLLSVIEHARQQRDYLNFRWVAMLTPEEAEVLLNLGTRI